MQIPTVPSHILVSVDGKVLTVTLNRPERLNAVSGAMEKDMCTIMDWFEDEPSLWVLVITGSGRFFCAGSDLKEFNTNFSESPGGGYLDHVLDNVHGFASLSRRVSRKPFIAAMNGTALGGGAEIVVNCDIVIAADSAELGFPEVKRGMVASVGGIPNSLSHTPLFFPYLVTGQNIPDHLLKTHLFTDVVPAAQVLATAHRWGQAIVDCSPDAVQVTKVQKNIFMEGKGWKEVVEEGLRRNGGVFAGENARDGLRAFVEYKLEENTVS
ncbi:hypothetical protein RQP46_000063 [Phenoliferia psychrophenolica]